MPFFILITPIGAFFFIDPATTENSTLSLHDALPIYRKAIRLMQLADRFGLPVVTLVDTSGAFPGIQAERSEEHTSELQSRRDLVCRLLLEKKKNKYSYSHGLFQAILSIDLARRGRGH